MRKAGSMVTVRSALRRAKRSLLALAAAAAATGLATGTLVAIGAAPASAASLPCDIYASGGTPCVAAHSTTRALYASYNGPLYQVRRRGRGRVRHLCALPAPAQCITTRADCVGHATCGRRTLQRSLWRAAREG